MIFPVSLLELACDNNVQLFINTDSYFNKNNLSYLYLENYSLSKKTLNLWLKNFSKKIKVINLVLEHIYGNGDSNKKFVTTMIDKIALEQVDSIDITYGDQKRDFIFIDDVCNAYLKALEYGLNTNFHYKSFEVGTGIPVKINDFVSKIKKLSNSNTKINFGAIPYRDDEIMISVADNLDLINLGWKPEYDLENGLIEILKRGV